MHRIFLVLLLQFSLCVPAFARDFPRLFRVAGVAMDGALNVHEAPDTGSMINGAFPPGLENIEVIRLSDDGRWGQVNFQEGSGWVSMRYMQDLGEKSWQISPRSLSCFGTEPFWNAIIDADVSRSIRFNQLDQASQHFQLDLWMRHDEGAPAGADTVSSNADRVVAATFQSTSCSDGMSDRSYGISVRFLISAKDLNSAFASEAYNGCCSLLLP